VTKKDKLPYDQPCPKGNRITINIFLTHLKWNQYRCPSKNSHFESRSLSFRSRIQPKHYYVLSLWNCTKL